YVSTQAQGGQWQNARSAAEDVFDEIEAHGSPPSIKTGIGPLDGRMGGLFRGDLTILAGRPAMGKSAIAQNIAFNAARNGHVVALFSMEMDKRQLTYRAATMQLHHDSNEVIAYRDIRKNVLRRDQLESLRRAARNLPPVEYETASGLRIDNLRSRLRRLKVARGGLDLVVVDYLQIMDIARERGQNDASAIQKVTGAFKQLAMELDCVVVLLSQLSREVERRDNKRPMLSDLRDSGAIEQDADVVIFAYRDWYYEKDDMGKGDAMSAMEQEARLKELEPRLDLIVAKARMDNPGTVTCFWSAPSAYIAQTLEEARGFQ
ncbi:MAG: DnaB-like helicase C-terminal domain-containing protein, partial [Pseudomonadota bacterium]